MFWYIRSIKRMYNAFIRNCQTSITQIMQNSNVLPLHYMWSETEPSRLSIRAKISRWW